MKKSCAKAWDFFVQFLCKISQKKFLKNLRKTLDKAKNRGIISVKVKTFTVKAKFLVFEAYF